MVAPLVLFVPFAPSDDSPGLFLLDLLVGHESNRLLPLRGPPELAVNESSVPTDIGSGSSFTSGIGDAMTAGAFFFLLACVVDGGVAGLLVKRVLTGVVTSSSGALIETSALPISISVTASSSTSSRSLSCSSDGNKRRGLIALLVSGRCAAAPAWRLRRRCSGVPLRSVDGAPLLS